ncbi:MAG: hypothetical protein ACI9TV_002548 [Sulfurimonas sp.]|jgi:hypothetical protein|uniref:SHOCT domain-containing protein n=1 Tax=Sulfurimonas sp. TaxID=2022749 RepID=UPI0039E6AC38
MHEIDLNNKANEIKNDTSLSNGEKFDKLTSLYGVAGYVIKYRKDNQIQLVKKKEFSIVWSIIWFLLWIFPFVIYLLYYLSKSDIVITITLPTEKEEVINANKPATTSVADEIKKLSDLLKESLITEEEFAIQKAKIFSK